MRSFLVVLLLLIAASSPAETDDFTTLVDWMSGSFSSQAQAAVDSAFSDIRLEMVRIWPERQDGAWLYVEQSVASALERPYRQRVYHVEDPGEGRYTSTVYALPDPGAMVGAWQDPARLAELGPADRIVSWDRGWNDEGELRFSADHALITGR